MESCAPAASTRKRMSEPGLSLSQPGRRPRSSRGVEPVLRRQSPVNSTSVEGCAGSRTERALRQIGREAISSAGPTVVAGSGGAGPGAQSTRWLGIGCQLCGGALHDLHPAAISRKNARASASASS